MATYQLIPWLFGMADRFRLYRTGGFTRLEARNLVDILRRVSPVRTGTLRQSWLKRRNQVISTAPHARIASEGGRVQGRNRQLFIPVRAFVTPYSAGNVTVQGRGGPYVFSRSTRDLMAVKRDFVVVRGTGYLSRAENELLRGAPGRAVEELQQLGDLGAPMPVSVVED